MTNGRCQHKKMPDNMVIDIFFPNNHVLLCPMSNKKLLQQNKATRLLQAMQLPDQAFL